SKAFRQVNARGEGDTVSYDLHRRRTRITDARGFIQTHYFDRNGQLERLEEPDGSILLFKHTAADGLRFEKIDALGRTTSYSYNTSRTYEGCETEGVVGCEADRGGQIT